MKTIGSGAPGTALQDWAIRIGVALMASLITAIIGPFATYENFSFVERLLYWGGLIMGLLVPGFIVRTIIYRFLSGSPLKQDIIAVGVLSVIIGPVVWAFNLFVMGFDLATPLMLLEHIGIVALICTVPVSIRAYLRLRLREIHGQEPADEAQETIMTEGQAAFLRRLEPEKRGDVRRVSADNHQVEVWTDQGGSKLRLRFGDALDELVEFRGTRIHRSHWVAFDTIEAVVPDGRRHAVRLNCGSRLPVSQNGLKALRDAGIGIEDRSAAAAANR